MSTDGSRARVNEWEKLSDLVYGERRAELRRHGTRRLLLVSWADPQLGLILQPDNLDFPPMTIPGGWASIKDLARKYEGFIKEISSRRYTEPSLERSAWLNLEAQGRGLFEILLPDELRRRMRAWPDGTVLGISSNTDWIPWELMHDGRGFLGQRLLLIRMPRMRPGECGTAAGATAARGAAGSEAMILNVIGGGLDGAADACQGLFANVAIGIEVRLLECASLADLLDVIGQADLVHITCHGHRDPLRLQIYRHDDQVLNLNLDSLRLGDFQLKPRCVVYANACNSAAADCLLGEFASFGTEFFRKGADTYIGTLGTVPTDGALAYAHRFYEELSACGGDVFHAYQAAKTETAATGPACLLFCIYGNYVRGAKLALFPQGGKR